MGEMNPLGRLRSVGGRSNRSDDKGELDERSQMASWLEAAGRGDQQAFGQLYDAMANRVYGIILRVLKDPAQAEEVAQEVFVEVWRLAPRYDQSRGSAASWMSTIAHRRAVDREGVDSAVFIRVNRAPEHRVINHDDSL